MSQLVFNKDEYSDIKPLSTFSPDLLPSPASIDIPRDWEVLLGIFYALVIRGMVDQHVFCSSGLEEKSARALALTTLIIALNSASYTAWLWRRQYVLFALIMSTICA